MNRNRTFVKDFNTILSLALLIDREKNINCCMKRHPTEEIDAQTTLLDNEFNAGGAHEV